ncbi:formyltransferase family protein [Halostella sp. PRR32]|uniref:formyltransferase family protein n=1 Tax=Halostella sp. PRR32 TaxID=3098147 RepID=UPI002B1DE405|nr:formyltransferase family protein [Halostella sp. PRR32]
MNVAVLANPMVSRWQEAALENVASLSGVSIERVVVDASVRAESSQLNAGAAVINQGRSVSAADLSLFVDVLRDSGLKSLIYADRKLGWTAFGEDATLHHLQSSDVTAVDCLSDAVHHEVEPVPADGAWNTLPNGVTDTIADDCSVVIRFGFGLLKGRILTDPEHGVLSTHGSDIRQYRGMGPKISFVRGDDEVSVTLQRLTEDIDGGEIVDVSSRELPPHPTLDEVLATVRDLQSESYAAGIEKLRRDDFEPWEPDELGPYYSHDNQERRVGFVARVLLKNNWHRVRKRLVGREDIDVDATPSQG